MLALELSGERIGRLLCIRRAPRDAKGRLCWECLCDCGKTVIKSAGALMNKRVSTHSCGCLTSQRLREVLPDEVTLAKMTSAQAKQRLRYFGLGNEGDIVAAMIVIEELGLLKEDKL